MYYVGLGKNWAEWPGGTRSLEYTSTIMYCFVYRHR